METAFGFTPEEFAWFGGYPGSALIYKDEPRWKNYVINSLIETSITKDILLVTRIHKPALLRNLFYLGCQYSGQILSYTKMIGQLHEAGNTTTLADYLHLLGSAGLLSGLEKFSGSRIIKRSSSPKLQVLNTALISAQSRMKFSEAITDLTFWGRVVESAIGAHLVNSSQTGNYEVNYWREGNMEVDFVLQKDSKLSAIEVKSGVTDRLPGIRSFSAAYPKARLILVGHQGIPWQELLRINPVEIL